MIVNSLENKTKYFRLRLSDEVSTERPETDLRLTWSHPEESDDKRWRIRALDKLVPDGDCDSLSSLTEPKIIDSFVSLDFLLFIKYPLMSHESVKCVSDLKFKIESVTVRTATDQDNNHVFALFNIWTELSVRLHECAYFLQLLTLFRGRSGLL